jgi:allantoin racemase
MNASMTASSRYRFLLIPANRRNGDLPKEQRLMNYAAVKSCLADVDWDLAEGVPGSGWVLSREAFCRVSAGMLPIVRQACESGRYQALVLLGGGDPGFTESREIARPYGIPVTSCAWAQMHTACTLGHRFSVIDLPESHNQYYADLVVRYRFADRCASIRNIDDPDPPPGTDGKSWLFAEKERAMRGEPVPVVERAVREAVAAIEEDGAEVITFGCSGSFWLKPFVEKRLKELGWEVPVIEGYQCAITVARLLVNLAPT